MDARFGSLSQIATGPMACGLSTSKLAEVNRSLLHISHTLMLLMTYVKAGHDETGLCVSTVSIVCARTGDLQGWVKLTVFVAN
jgi:hypothetical protein